MAVRNLFSRLRSSLLIPALEKTMATQSRTNRLSKEKSPYLLQHATNPVDWFPWGEEAFHAARTQNKLIFLSVGYSTCHWCHVMERESFESEEISKIMNDNFINIKVDREERPDVDKVYMTFVTASSGHGGWPMSVFLTPDLKPVAGGTYFPPFDKYGRPGFSTVLSSLATKWKSDETKFKDSGKKILEVLKKHSRLSADDTDLPSEEAFVKAFTQFSRIYEPDYGGFGDEPKFPQPSNFNFLFTYKALNPLLDDAKTGVDMCLHTLRMMERGGIHDHIAQGFARYSTDRKWHVPHFEKMLYDQAQLVMSYLDAYLHTKEPLYSTVVKDILTYVLRDLSHPLGGFYSAEDADSLPTSTSESKREGAFCVWTHQEVCDLLSEPLCEGGETKLFQLFNFHYSVMQNGNLEPYQDPHDELKNQNVLIVHGTVAETAAEFGIEEPECERYLEKARQILYTARKSRPRPHLDDKMLTAWNGMMLAATARAGAVLNEKTYIDRAIQNAEFLRKYLYRDGAVLRAAYKASEDAVSLGSEIRGFSDDYAWLIRGLFHLYDATLDDAWLRWAEELQDKQNELFWDHESGGYFMGQKDDDTILLRLKDDSDGAEPSVNSVSAGNLVRLSRLLNRPDYESKAVSIFKAFSDRLSKVPVSLPEMSTALMLHHNPAEQIILAGARNAPDLEAMLEVVHANNLNPNRILLFVDADSNESSLLFSRNEVLRKFIPKPSETTAYVCKDFACSLPLKSLSMLKEKMVNG